MFALLRTDVKRFASRYPSAERQLLAMDGFPSLRLPQRASARTKRGGRSLPSFAPNRRRISLLSNRHFGKDDGKSVQCHRLNQHQCQNQGKLNAWPGARIARQAFASRCGGLRLGIATNCGSNRHSKSGSDNHPLGILCAAATARRPLCECRRGNQKALPTRSETSQHNVSLSSSSELSPTLGRVHYEFPPVGGFPPTLKQAGLTLAVLQNWNWKLNWKLSGAATLTAATANASSIHFKISAPLKPPC